MKFKLHFRCDASLLMADIPEDVKLEQLLELREQLREQIDQLNANSTLEPSNCMRKISKYRHPDRYQAKTIKKVEKRPNSWTTDSCVNDKVAKVSLPGRMEDRRNEQPSCSGVMKKLSEEDHGTWVQDIPATYRQNLRQCPFRHKSGLSLDTVGAENGPKKLSLQSESNEVVPNEIPNAGIICTTKIDDIPV